VELTAANDLFVFVTISTLNYRVGNDEGMTGLQTYKPQKM